VKNPLLIQGLKFDLRVYVLVTSYEPLRVYVYREGLVRFACRPYSNDPQHLTDAYRHLTNYSINKGSATFVENSQVHADNVGHKWSFSALNRHLKCTGVDVQLMWTRIMDVIMKSLLAVEPVIGARTKTTACHSHNCFELYGFDVLVDKELKPWLLEVNLSPSMQADSPLDWQIKGSLLADCFNLVGINRVSKQRLAEATRAKAKVLKVPGKPPGPPERRKRQFTRGRSALLRPKESVEADAEELYDLPSVPLGALELEELRSAANALLECTRNRNFIRLFPTSRAVQHYAVIVDSQEAMKPWPRGRKPAERLTSSQVLASLLFGPPPSHGTALEARPRCRAILCCRRIAVARPREDPQCEDGEEAQQALPCARAKVVRARSVATLGWEKMEKSGARLRSNREDPATSALQENGCRLAILEYLIRVHNRCSQLSHADRHKASQPEVTARLDAFCSIRSQANYGDDTTVVDRLQMACRAEMIRLVKLYWEHGSVLDGSVIHLASLLPALARRSEGQQALEKLALMTAAELERFLVGPTCDAQFRALLENYLVAGRGYKSPSQRGILRSRSAAPGLGGVRRAESATLVAGPLSELLCLPLTVGRAETPSQEKGRSNRRVMMKRTPAESLMEAGDVEPDSVAEVVKDPLPVARSRPQSGRSRASSRPASGRALSNSRPPSRGGRSRPGSAVKLEETPKASARLELPLQSLESEDALTSFVSHMERNERNERMESKVSLTSLSPSPSRRRNLERTPLAAPFPKGDEPGSSPFAKSARIKLFQFATCDIEL